MYLRRDMELPTYLLCSLHREAYNSIVDGVRLSAADCAGGARIVVSGVSLMLRQYLRYIE
jgi:hypothetical protein